VVRVFDLAWKDLLEIGRDWKSALFLLIMPILFTLFFGVILGPAFQAGEAFAAVGHVMPTAWAMDGLQNVVVRGLGLESVLVPAGLMLAYTAAFFGLAVWRFEFE
jgi:ABC-2 type transport system permease protein